MDVWLKPARSSVARSSLTYSTDQGISFQIPECYGDLTMALDRETKQEGSESCEQQKAIGPGASVQLLTDVLDCVVVARLSPTNPGRNVVCLILC